MNFCNTLNKYALNNNNMQQFMMHQYYKEKAKIYNKSQQKKENESKKNEDFFIPDEKDSIFWCWFIFRYGFSEYEILKKNTFTTEKEYKINFIEKMRSGKQTLKKLGAELIEVDAVPYTNPKNYIKQSKQIAEDLNKTSPNGVYWANQFDNTVNSDAHIETTAKEIWNQTAGNVDGFTCAVGTGGTLAGVSIGLKNKNKDIKIALSDPMGSALYSHHKNNKLESNGSSITEGIGNGRITKNFDKALIDDAFQTDDIEALNLVYDLIEKQKIVLGGSSGINIAGAIKLAKQLGPGKTIVTILCDHGRRYASKIFNKEFLKSKNLPIPKWL